MVLLVLALAWGAVLFFWFRSRSQGAFADSVGLFHRHLHVLERAAPGTLAPANRLRVPAGPVAFGTLRPPTGPTRRAPRGAGGSSSAMVASARRRETLRRRRDVLFVLTILVVATFVVAAVTRGTYAIGAQLLSDLALGSYIALLVRLRNLAAEQELKLRPLRVGVAPARARVAGRPAALRPAGRPALAGGYAMAAGYGGAVGRSGLGGYGQVAMRRTAGSF